MLRKLILVMVIILFLMLFVNLASAARYEGSISVADTVWGGTTTAIVDAPAPPRDATDNYVFAQCWALDGEYLYAAFFPIVDGTSVLGPFKTGSTWTTSESANCKATISFFRRDGFGKRVDLATTNFNVI
jgi:hypothetical protein